MAAGEVRASGLPKAGAGLSVRLLRPFAPFARTGSLPSQLEQARLTMGFQLRCPDVGRRARHRTSQVRVISVKGWMYAPSPLCARTAFPLSPDGVGSGDAERGVRDKGHQFRSRSSCCSFFFFSSIVSLNNRILARHRHHLTAKNMTNPDSATTRALQVPELVSIILEQVGRMGDWAKASRVNRMWHAQCEAIMYVNPSHDGFNFLGGVGRRLLLVRTLASRPDLARRVKAFIISSSAFPGMATFEPPDPTEAQLFMQLIIHTTKLTDLSLECES